MSKKELIKRYAFFVFGLFVNSLGISLITKSDMGTSPISSIPYTLSIGLPLSLGMFTLIFSLLLIVIQLIIMRKNFPKQYWLQIPVSLIFSYFIDLTMSMLDFLDPDTYLLQAVSLVAGCIVLGTGVFMETAANVVMLPGECTVKAITTVSKIDFGKSKIAMDVTMSVIAAVIGIVMYHKLAGAREGTFISALAVGFIARLLNKSIGKKIQTIFS